MVITIILLNDNFNTKGMASEYEYGGYPVQEKFNAGIATAMEIRKLLNYCNQISTSDSNDKFRLWAEALDDLYRETYPLIKDHFEKDEELNVKKFEELRKKIRFQLAELDKQFNNPRIMRFGVDCSEQFDTLDIFEKKIRMVLHKRNLLFPAKEELQF